MAIASAICALLLISAIRVIALAVLTPLPQINYSPTFFSIRWTEYLSIFWLVIGWVLNDQVLISLLIIFNMSILLWMWKEYIILFFLSLQQVRNLCILIHARSSGLNLKIVYFTMQLIVIRFSCATFVAIEEDICPTIIEKFIPCRTISSVIGTGESWFWSIIEVFMI